jgi:hypothetical protein
MSNIPISIQPVPTVKPSFTKYRLTNNGDKVITINYQRSDDFKWVYQDKIIPGQTKNFWAVHDSVEIPDFFKTELLVEEEQTYYTTENGCTFGANTGPGTHAILISSVSPNPPQIKVEYLIQDSTNGFDPYNFAPYNWNLLGIGTPSQCPSFTLFGRISLPNCTNTFILKVTDVATNKIVDMYWRTVNAEPCPLPYEYSPCNPNSYNQLYYPVSGCDYVGYSNSQIPCPPVLGIPWASYYTLRESQNLYPNCTFDFEVYYTCTYSPDTINVGSMNLTGGFPPYQGATTVFQTEAAALANTSWFAPCWGSCGTAYGLDPTQDGTFWIANKDSTGQVKAKSITTFCRPTTPTPTASPTNTPSVTPTNTPTQTSTQTQTPTNTPTQTNTGTPTNTPTQTNTPTNTQTSTNTPTNTQTPTQTPSNTPEPTPTPTPEWTYINVTQYLDCVQNSSPGAFQMRIPSTMGGSWFYTGDGYQYQFDSNQLPPFSSTLEATSSSSGCIS